MSDVYALFGLGGFGSEVAPLIQHFMKHERRTRDAEVVFVTDLATNQSEINGLRLISLDNFLSHKGGKFFNVAVADSNLRQQLAELCISNSAKPFSIAAPTARVLNNNQIAEGSILCDFSIITSNTKIGRFFHANIYSYVAHDCVIGDFVTFAPGVKCNGNVHIGDHVYIGTGAIIRDGKKLKPLTIGAHATIGMGAVVTRDVEPGATVVGNPARVITTSK